MSGLVRIRSNPIGDRLRDYPSVKPTATVLKAVWVYNPANGIIHNHGRMVMLNGTGVLKNYTFQVIPASGKVYTKTTTAYSKGAAWEKLLNHWCGMDFLESDKAVTISCIGERTYQERHI